MPNFINETTPFPIVQGVTNAIKNSTILQYYRTESSSNGIQITVNSTTHSTLPENVFNILQSELGYIIFKNGNTAVFKKQANYVHNIIINMYSTYPKVGISAVDLIDKQGVSLKQNAVVTKNITPNNAEVLLLSIVQKHSIGDEVQLRFGGGSVPSGGDLELNILAINWIILEQ